MCEEPKYLSARARLLRLARCAVLVIPAIAALTMSPSLKAILSSERA